MKKPVNSSSASVNQKQFWIEIRLDVSRKQGPKHIRPDLDPNCLILNVFLIFCYFSEKRSLWRKSEGDTFEKSYYTTKTARLLSMLPALNYPVGLHDLCLILQLPHNSYRVTKALVRLILAFGVCLCGKKKCVFQDILSSRGVLKMKYFWNNLSTITKFKCQTVWIETRYDVFVSKVQACLSLTCCCSRLWNTTIYFLTAFSMAVSSYKSGLVLYYCNKYLQ